MTNATDGPTNARAPGFAHGITWWGDRPEGWVTKIALYAEDFMVETVAAPPGEVTLIAVAPLGNLARAILKAPEVMRQVRHIFLMGGVFDHSREDLPAAEHNIVSDPGAAQVVFGFGLSITLFPLDVTTRTALGPAEVGRLDEVPGPLARLLHAELVNWMSFIRHGHGRDPTPLHDPLTVAALV